MNICICVYVLGVGDSVLMDELIAEIETDKVCSCTLHFANDNSLGETIIKYVNGLVLFSDINSN